MLEITCLTCSSELALCYSPDPRGSSVPTSRAAVYLEVLDFVSTLTNSVEGRGCVQS